MLVRVVVVCGLVVFWLAEVGIGAVTVHGLGWFGWLIWLGDFWVSEVWVVTRSGPGLGWFGWVMWLGELWV